MLRGRGRRDTYRLLLVAFSICSSRAVLAPDDHQLIILERSGGTGKGCVVCEGGDAAMRQTPEVVGVEPWELRRGGLTDGSRERATASSTRARR
jgi:hypothetical protein